MHIPACVTVRSPLGVDVTMTKHNPKVVEAETKLGGFLGIQPFVDLLLTRREDSRKPHQMAGRKALI